MKKDEKIITVYFGFHFFISVLPLILNAQYDPHFPPKAWDPFNDKNVSQLPGNEAEMIMDINPLNRYNMVNAYIGPSGNLPANGQIKELFWQESFNNSPLLVLFPINSILNKTILTLWRRPHIAE